MVAWVCHDVNVVDVVAAGGVAVDVVDDVDNHHIQNNFV